MPRARMPESFTRRQAQVFGMLLELKTNKEIAAAFGISERTAKFHVSRIFTRLREAGEHEAAKGRVALWRRFSSSRPPRQAA